MPNAAKIRELWIETLASSLLAPSDYFFISYTLKASKLNNVAEVKMHLEKFFS